MSPLIHIVALLVALAQAPEFEVATIKPTPDPGARSLLQAVPGRLMMSNLALRRLILNAWGVQDYQLTGDPPWLESAHYDIQAKAAGNVSVRQMEGPMLQALLEDRFKIKLHRETRQLPVYELTVAKNGPKLQPAKEGGCTAYNVDSPPLPPAPGEVRPNYCGARMSVEGLNRTLDAKGVTMEVLATNLSRTYTSVLGKNIIDATGIPGAFDFTLKWANDPLSSAALDSAGPTIFTALQDQLGLKLESTKGPVEVLVIDHIEKPSAN